MKIITCALLVLACLLPLRADSKILANSDFSDGRAHWKGDAEDAANEDPTLIDNSSAAAGVVIKLKKDKFTKIYQTFTIRDPKLYYTVTFQLSADYKIDSSGGDSSPADLGDVPGFYEQMSLPEDCWSMYVPTANSWSEKTLQPDMSKKGVKQTLTGRLSDLTPNYETVFLLAFPPGKGSVTLYNVSLSNTDPSADP